MALEKQPTVSFGVIINYKKNNMGFGTDFTADIYLSRERFETEYELDSKIEETKDYIRVVREKILMACMNGKEAFNVEDCEGNKCDLVDVVHRNINEYLDWLLELNNKLYEYELLKKNFDKREHT